MTSGILIQTLAVAILGGTFLTIPSRKYDGHRDIWMEVAGLLESLPLTR